MNVIVIGAGIVGCAVGYELASRGARVRLFDMRDVGRGATQASAGVLCPHIEGHAAPLLQLGVRSLGMWDDFVARATADARRPVEYRRTGTLEVALTEVGWHQLESAAGELTRTRVDHQLLEAGGARRLEPALADGVLGALFVPAHGYVAVTPLTEVLSAAAEARGASMLRGVTVERLVAEDSTLRVESSAGSETADAVIVAAGSWSGPLGPAAVPVKPIRGQLLHLSAQAPIVSRVIWGAEAYIVPWQDGTVLVGATVEDVGFDERPTVAGVRDLLDHACELLPALWNATFLGVRVGLRPATDDGLPIIGRSSTHPGIVYATGHYRNGVLLAPLTAAAVADLLLAGREAPELQLTSPARFGL